MILTTNSRLLIKRELTKIKIIKLPQTITTYKRNGHRKLVR